QGQILEHEVEKLVLGYLDDKILFSFTGVACLAGATGSTATPFRPGNAGAGGEVPVAANYPRRAPPGTGVEDRLDYIPRRDAALLATLQGCTAPPAARLFGGYLAARLVAAHDALAVARGFVLPVQSTHDYITHGPTGASCTPLVPSFKLALLLQWFVMPLNH